MNIDDFIKDINLLYAVKFRFDDNDDLGYHIIDDSTFDHTIIVTISHIFDSIEFNAIQSGYYMYDVYKVQLDNLKTEKDIKEFIGHNIAIYKRDVSAPIHEIKLLYNQMREIYRKSKVLCTLDTLTLNK